MTTDKTSKSRRNIMIVLASLVAVIILAFLIFSPKKTAENGKVTVKAEKEHGEGEEHGEEHGEENEVELDPEVLEAAGVEFFEVSERSMNAMLRFTGTVEANQQQTQQITPLVGGRVERVNVALGDRVRAGAVIAVISSPEVAEMHGKLHEAETKFGLAEQNYQRVLRAESRASLIQAKARLDEAEATLRRTQKLIEVGAGAGKDLIAAETAYKSAKAEYDYQNNISLNREVQQAKAEVETSRVEVMHLRNSLRSLGSNESSGGRAGTDHNTATLALVAPVSGTVTERMVNAGAGIEPGKPIFTISNISTLWAIANVPEAQVGQLREGMRAEVRSASLGTEAVAGRIAYIDPLLNEETRSARVRVEIANPQERLKVGMFVEISFEGLIYANGNAKELAVMIPEAAVQRMEDRAVVFIPKEGEEGHFEIREVELGGASGGFHRVISGLKAGERVVTKGSFTLKTQKMKGEMGEHGH